MEYAQGFQIITSVHKNKTDFGKALEMLIQNVFGHTLQGRLVIQWENQCEALANCVEIGTNADLTENRKMFVLPVTTNCALATGTGKFFYRVGAFVGEKLRGTIEWSGLYGPIQINSNREAKPPPLTPLRIHHAQQQVDGIRYHTGTLEPYYAIIEYSKGPFNASQKSFQYVLDSNRGYVDLLGIPHEFSYTVRITTMEGMSGRLPNGYIVEVSDGKIMTNQKSMKLQSLGIHQDRAAYAAASEILKQEQEGRPIKFTSHAEYTKFLAIKAISTGKKQTV